MERTCGDAAIERATNDRGVYLFHNLNFIGTSTAFLGLMIVLPMILRNNSVPVPLLDRTLESVRLFLGGDPL